jgi:molecular chaperone GrpE
MSLSKDDKGKKPKTAALEKTPESEALPEDVAELQSRLQEKTKEAEEHYERLLRLAAELENVKKRQERDRAELLQFANENLIKELLPVVDNLELALEHGRQLEAPEALMEGLERVHQSFLTALGKFGVTPLTSVGQPFDPAFHNAVMQEATAAVPDCTVLNEIQKGYLLHNRLIRPAMVVVARKPEKSSACNTETVQEEKIDG